VSRDVHNNNTTAVTKIYIAIIIVFGKSPRPIATHFSVTWSVVRRSSVTFVRFVSTDLAGIWHTSLHNDTVF